MKACCQNAQNPQQANKSSALNWRSIASLPFIVIIRFYQLVVSPWLGPKCRYQPTCSHYALEAFKKYGPFKGFWLALKRISRCHPWGGSGWDPVP
jgi:putative membrane protein insertion efficiency factor